MQKLTARQQEAMDIIKAHNGVATWGRLIGEMRIGGTSFMNIIQALERKGLIETYFAQPDWFAKIV